MTRFIGFSTLDSKNFFKKFFLILASENDKISLKKGDDFMATLNQEYKDKNYDRLAIWVKKGTREEYKQTAARLGMSLSMLVQNSVEAYGANHAGEVMTVKPENQLSAADKKLVEEFNALSPKSQKALREIISELVDKKGGD